MQFTVKKVEPQRNNVDLVTLEAQDDGKSDMINQLLGSRNLMHVAIGKRDEVTDVSWDIFATESGYTYTLKAILPHGEVGLGDTAEVMGRMRLELT